MTLRRPPSSALVASFVALGFVAPCPASADGDARSMTLAQAIEYAHAHHPRIAAVEQEVAAREADRAVPRSRWVPRVGVTAQLVGSTNNNSATNWLGSRGAVEFPRIAGTGFLQQPGTVNFRPYANTAVGAGFEQEIFDFGRIAAEQATADARARAARARGDQEELDVVLDVREAFYAVRAAHEVLVAAAQAVHRAEVHRDATCALSERGLRPHADCQRVVADLARYRASVARAEGSLSAARVALAGAIGFEDGEIDVEEVDPPAAAEDAATNVPTSGMESTVDTALAHEPELRAAESDAEAAEAESRRAAAERRPQVYAVGAVLGSAGGAPTEATASKQSSVTYGSGTVPWIPNYYAGAIVSWNVLDAPAAARSRAARAEAEAARRRVDALRERVRTRAAQAWVETDAAVRAQAELEHALEAARISYAETEGRYNAGLATLVELIDAEALRIDAEVSIAVGRYAVSRSEARLERALAEESAR